MTNILLRITKERKAEYEVEAERLGLSLSEWLRGLADSSLGLAPIEMKAPGRKRVKEPPSEKNAKLIKGKEDVSRLVETQQEKKGPARIIESKGKKYTGIVEKWMGRPRYEILTPDGLRWTFEPP